MRLERPFSRKKLDIDSIYITDKTKITTALLSWFLSVKVAKQQANTKKVLIDNFSSLVSNSEHVLNIFLTFGNSSASMLLSTIF